MNAYERNVYIFKTLNIEIIKIYYYATTTLRHLKFMNFRKKFVKFVRIIVRKHYK